MGWKPPFVEDRYSNSPHQGLREQSYCLTAPRIDLIHPKPKFNPNAERTLPEKEAAQIAGSFEKRRRILEDKESLEGIYNEGKDELYHWRRMGDVLALPNTAMPQVPLDRIGAQVLNGTLSMSPLLEARAVDAYLSLPENLMTLTQEFTDWGSHWLDELDAAIAAKAAGQKYPIRTTGELRHVGALSERLIEKLEQRGLIPYSAILSVRDQDVVHAFREAKVGEVSRAWYLRLPEHLREPKAVLLDTTHERPALLYVYDVEGQTAKLVVEVDYLVGERGKDGRKITRPANIVGTGRFVPLANLKKSYGKPLEGTL